MVQIRRGASVVGVQAVILAGGKGTRLRPLTYTVPKPLLPVMGRPLVDHLIAALPPEVDEILLTVSYMADHLRRWVEDTEDPALRGREVIVVEELEPLGTAGAVANCADHLDDTFFVLNGDLLSDVDHVKLLEYHRKKGGHGTLSLYRVDDPTRFGVVAQDDDGRIRRFVEKPSRAEAPSDRVNAGAYVLEQEVLDHIPRGQAVSIEREVFPVLAATECGLWGLPFEGLWIDCGTPESYLDVHRLLLARQGARYQTGPGTQLMGPEPDVEATVFGSDVHVGPGVSARACVVHDGARVEADAHLVRSIIGTRATIGAGAELVDVVVGPEETVPPGVRLQNERVGMRSSE